MAETSALFTQFGPGVAVMVLLILLLYKLRDRVGGRVDDSVDSMFDRLEREIQRKDSELEEERETNRLYRLAQEKKIAAHRRWDSQVLQTALSGGDVSKLPNPPSLTPHPSEYEPTKPTAPGRD